MKNKGKLTENIKIRVTKEQKMAIRDAAQKEMVSESDYLRNVIFSLDLSTGSTELGYLIMKHEFRNMIVDMNIPERYKKELVEVVSNIV